jgi:hypothetical protein
MWEDGKLGGGLSKLFWALWEDRKGAYGVFEVRYEAINCRV